MKETIQKCKDEIQLDVAYTYILQKCSLDLTYPIGFDIHPLLMQILYRDNKNVFLFRTLNVQSV
jgi:hypothetical protein